MASTSSYSTARALVGSRGLWTPHSWSEKTSPPRVNVTILDVRELFGRVEMLVEPVSGEGEQWVNASSVTPQGSA